MRNLVRLAVCFLCVGSGAIVAWADDPGGQITREMRMIREWQLYNNNGWRAVQQGNYVRAERAFHEAIAIVRPYEKTERRLMARSYGSLAQVLYQEGRYDEAEPLAKWVLKVRETEKGVKPDAVFQSLFLLGVVQRAQHRYGEAESTLRRALTLQEKIVGPNRYELAATLDVLAGVLSEQQKYKLAEPLYKQALAILDKVEPDQNPELAETSTHYAQLLRQTNRAPEAEDMEATAKMIEDTLATNATRVKRPQPNPGRSGVR